MSGPSSRLTDHRNADFPHMRFLKKGFLRLFQIAQRIAFRHDRPNFPAFDIAHQIGKNAWLLPGAAHQGQVLEVERAQVQLHDRPGNRARGHIAPARHQRVEQFGPTRPSDEVVALIPPNLVEGTVEKVAVNAVMAGCRPEYLPVVLAALEAICTDEFNMHGVLATTMSVGPILVVNGPIAAAIGMNSGINVLGHGNRANSSIGRAVQLVLRNVGGGAPGGIDRATLGHMGKQGICFAEDEAGSPWNSLAEERGFDRSQSTVTAFCGEGPRLVVDQLSRSPESLTRSLAASLRSAVSPNASRISKKLSCVKATHRLLTEKLTNRCVERR